MRSDGKSAGNPVSDLLGFQCLGVLSYMKEKRVAKRVCGRGSGLIGLFATRVMEFAWLVVGEGNGKRMGKACLFVGQMKLGRLIGTHQYSL